MLLEGAFIMIKMGKRNLQSILYANYFAEIATSLSFEAMFYFGLATFLTVTDRIQRPYLQFSSKRWGLITGLRGYLTSAFFVMGFKVIAPLFAVFVTWPVLGLPALVAVLPFLVGCLAQRLFETYLDKRGSSCWPLVPIIFEVHDFIYCNPTLLKPIFVGYNSLNWFDRFIGYIS